MKLTIDEAAGTLSVADGTSTKEVSLYSREAFEILSRQWLRVGWNQKYTYTFSWLGRPVIQLPDDMLRIQELIARIEPDWIIETGVAHGGSLVYYASLCHAIGRGHVVGVDIEIRPHNRSAIESHRLARYITLIEGSSTARDVVRKVGERIEPQHKVLVILDSNHTKEHVAAELDAYHRFVTPGSYIVATDGYMEELHDVPRGHASWREDNPAAAAREFAASHRDFVLEQPAWQFNESELVENVTHWPAAYLRKL